MACSKWPQVRFESGPLQQGLCTWPHQHPENVGIFCMISNELQHENMLECESRLMGFVCRDFCHHLRVSDNWL